jgi:histidine triad (HIT) family protein
MAGIFTRIIQGEIPSYKLAEDESHYAFLDINPVSWGHALVVPKTEVDYIFDLSADQLSGLMLFAQKVALAIEQEVPCLRIGISVIGLEVPHAHVHLIPLNSMADMDFLKPRQPRDAAEMKLLADKVLQRFQQNH